MKKNLLLILLTLIAGYGFCQTSIHSFESHIKPNLQSFTQSQIDTFISKANFEKYRLQDQRVTLSFDNGFEVVLLSANEMVQAGLISSSASYPVASSIKNKLPAFHLASTGFITAAYTVDHTKYK